MGCNSSKAFGQLDDSIHAMIKKQERRALARGEEPLQYRPRHHHPFLREIPCEGIGVGTTEAESVVVDEVELESMPDTLEGQITQSHNPTVQLTQIGSTLAQ